MTEATVFALPSAKKSPRKTVKKPARVVNPRKVEQASRRMRWNANFALGIAAVLTGLSLHQLTVGIQTFTGEPIWLAGALAVGIDLGVFAGKLCQLVVVGPDRDKLVRLSNLVVYGALAVSACLNVYGATAHAEGYVALAIGTVLGLFVPAMTLGLLRLGAGLYLACPLVKEAQK